MKTESPRFKEGDILFQKSACDNKYCIFKIISSIKGWYDIEDIENQVCKKLNISTVDNGNILLYPAEILTDELKVELL